MQSNIAIMASGLGKSYGEVTALEDAAFTVGYGERCSATWGATDRERPRPCAS